MKLPGNDRDAKSIIQRISELRELGRRLALAGYRARLHSRDPLALPVMPSVVHENRGRYPAKRS